MMAIVRSRSERKAEENRIILGEAACTLRSKSRIEYTDNNTTSEKTRFSQREHLRYSHNTFCRHISPTLFM
jgi:hypothetical protein